MKREGLRAFTPHGDRVRFTSRLLQLRRVLRQELRHRVVLHQELAELRPLGDENVHRLVDRARRKVHRPHQALRRRRQVKLGVAVQRQQVELPRLPAVELSQAVGVELDVVEVDDADGAEVLLDPGVLDGLGADAVEPLGEVAEGPGW